MPKKKLKISSDMQAILDAEGIRHFDIDIRRMKRAELVTNFAAESSGRILLTRVIKNIIWQAYEQISAGTAPPIEGNIRTFWYQWVKPVLSRFPDEDEAKKDPYDTMTELFTHLIMDLHLFKYAAFDFTDENWENRRIGTTRPQILIFAEKTGWIRFLRTLHEELGVSVIALGGAPSALSSEYTATHIKEAMSPDRPIHLIGIVDYDPSGDIIAQAFQTQLAAAGLESASLTTLIDPKHYSKDEIEIFKFDLPKGERTKLTQWLKKTGGIDGQAYGLESESMPRIKLRDLIDRQITAIERPPRGSSRTKAISKKKIANVADQRQAAQLGRVQAGTATRRTGVKQLTAREVEIIQLICEEMSSPEIGAQLGITARTVDAHRYNIHLKLRAKTVVGIVLYAIKTGICQL